MRELKKSRLRNFPKSGSWWALELGLERRLADLKIPNFDLALLLFKKSKLLPVAYRLSAI